jgi:ABC-type sugar transport system permease subunit
MKRHKVKKNVKPIKHNAMGYLFMSPWIFGFLAFTGFPFIYTLYLSFFQVTLTVRGWELVWNQYDNFISAFLRNVAFIPGMIGFTMYQLIYVPTIIVISFILAVMLNQKFRFRSTFRLIYFLPVIIMSGSVMQQLMQTGTTSPGQVEDSLVFSIVANYSQPLAYVINFLFDNFALVLWFTGVPIILIINGLQKIDISLYNAAHIDGANAWQSMWKITIPLIKPIVLIAAIFTIVQLGLYDLNPVHAMIQETIFNTTGGLGLASALSWVYTFVVLILVGIAFLIFKTGSGGERL